MTEEEAVFYHQCVDTDELLHAELNAQFAKHGGPRHDDTHTPEEFMAFICQKTTKALLRTTDPEATRRIMQTGALGYAVAQAWKREKERNSDARYAMERMKYLIAPFTP